MNKSFVAIIAAVTVLLGASTVFYGFYTGRDYAKGREIYDDVSRGAVFKTSAKDIADAASKDRSGLKIDFERLVSQNTEVKGWIYVPDTSISYPVVQSDNNNKYLKKAFTGERSGSGTIFLDKNCDENSRNVVMYGHHMNDGSMFACLEKFKEKDFFDGHKLGYYITPDAEYKAEFVSCILSEPKSSSFVTSYADDNQYAEYLRNIKESSLVKTDADVNINDRIISLVTCDYTKGNGRFVLIGKLTELR